MAYTIRFTEKAKEMLADIKRGSKRDYEKVLEVIRNLANEPDKRGKPLVDELSGLRSIRAAGQRFRVVYEVKEKDVTVLVLGAGLRKQGDRSDIYARLERLLSQE